MNKSIIKYSAVLFFLSAGACLVPQASAKVAVVEKDSQTKLVLEEIIVTAQKRAESIQDVPLAISAMSASQLRDDGVIDMSDIQGRIPNLIFAPFAIGQPEIAIRGIGTKEDGPGANDSTVVSVDDVYVAARSAQVFDIFDLERVEVLRGPQSTLYGKNSIGGSINFVTMKPDEVTRIRLEQTFAEHGRVDTQGLLNGTISENDNVYGKISFSRRKSDGYSKLRKTGEDLHGQDSLSARAQLRWVPNDDWEITATIDGAIDNSNGTNREPVAGVALLANQFSGGQDPFDSLADEAGYVDRQVYGSSLKIEHQIDNITLTSITGYRVNDYDYA